MTIEKNAMTIELKKSNASYAYEAIELINDINNCISNGDDDAVAPLKEQLNDIIELAVDSLNNAIGDNWSDDIGSVFAGTPAEANELVNKSLIIDTYKYGSAVKFFKVEYDQYSIYGDDDEFTLVAPTVTADTFLKMIEA